MKKPAKAAVFCAHITFSGPGGQVKIMDFSTDVAPVHHNQCLICHNEIRAGGNY